MLSTLLFLTLSTATAEDTLQIQCAQELNTRMEQALLRLQQVKAEAATLTAPESNTTTPTTATSADESSSSMPKAPVPPLDTSEESETAADDAVAESPV